MIIVLTLLFAVHASAQDRIVYEGGNSYRDIFLMNADGSWKKNLTEAFGPTRRDSAQPAISPDGRSVAFLYNPDLMQVFVLDLVTLGMRQVTHLDQKIPDSLAWSPDGRTIAFASCDPPFPLRTCDIFTTPADGSGAITPLANSPQDDRFPKFSPDGTRVVFESNRDGNYEIYICDSDGSNLRRLTTNIYDDRKPSWTTDGRHILFESLRELTYQIFVMNDDGSNLVQLTHTSSNGETNLDPRMSPNNGRVVWARSFTGNYEIVEAPFNDMDHPRRLTNNTANDLNPDYGFITRKVPRFFH